MKRILILMALISIGFVVKAQEVKIESNKILSIDKLAEIKGDTLFIYKDLEKALEVLNKDKNHKAFKYVVIVKEKLEPKGFIYLNQYNGLITEKNN